MNLDEHMQTTLWRVYKGLPVENQALDEAVRILVRAFTDPTNLKRPATRTCMWCRAAYKTRLSVLAAAPYCSSECQQAARADGADAMQLARDLVTELERRQTA